MPFDGSTWNETTPTNGDLANEIDDFMRDMKIGVRSRMAHEHIWSSSQTATGSDGQHRFITLTTQTSAPGLVYGTSTQAGAVYAISSGTGVSLVARNSAGYEVLLHQSTYNGGGVVPKGGIIMWSGTVANIPVGWALCNGSSGTPDLRDKFIVGAKQDDAGAAKTNVSGSLTQSGGAATVTLTTNEMPAHTHTVPTGNTGGGSYASEGSTSVASATSSSAGSGAAFSILNPYYALAFIMKL